MRFTNAIVAFSEAVTGASVVEAWMQDDADTDEIANALAAAADHFG